MHPNGTLEQEVERLWLDAVRRQPRVAHGVACAQRPPPQEFAGAERGEVPVINRLKVCRQLDSAAVKEDHDDPDHVDARKERVPQSDRQDAAGEGVGADDELRDDQQGSQ